MSEPDQRDPDLVGCDILVDAFIKLALLAAAIALVIYLCASAVSPDPTPWM